MTQFAYQLRDAYAASFAGGVLNVGGHDFNVAAELALGSGTITVDDLQPGADILMTVLDSYPPLRRTTVPNDPPPVVAEPYRNTPRRIFLSEQEPSAMATGDLWLQLDENGDLLSIQEQT